MWSGWQFRQEENEIKEIESQYQFEAGAKQPVLETVRRPRRRPREQTREQTCAAIADQAVKDSADGPVG